MNSLIDRLLLAFVAAFGAIYYALAWLAGGKEYRDWLKDNPDRD